MRKFKFRAWINNLNRLVYLSEEKHDLNISKYNDGLFVLGYGLIGPDITHDKYELMQYTGLKDKNGKEIYEGDIIKVDDNFDEYGMMAGEVREVYFFNGGFRLKDKKNRHEGHWLEGNEEFEIIGNIYENKELLK